jgi:hypothetical protein
MSQEQEGGQDNARPHHAEEGGDYQLLQDPINYVS